MLSISFLLIGMFEVNSGDLSLSIVTNNNEVIHDISITVDGVLKASITAPGKISLTQLSNGKHILSIQKNGYKYKEQYFELNKNSDLQLIIILDKLTSTNEEINKPPSTLQQLIDLQNAKSKQENNLWSKFQLKGYGVINYYNFDWDTDAEKRAVFDTERLNLYLYYDFNDKIQFKSEIEFEHGGTGSTMEFDKQEEFGEFETEVEAGGEILVEQINVLFKIKPYFNVRAGRVKVYNGIPSKKDRPNAYFTTYRSEIENTVLPLGWYENGIEILGDFGAKNRFSYKAYLVNGLDATGFSSRNWVRPGHQKRFETVNAQNLAIAARLDYKFAPNGEIGLFIYHGNSADNRPKPDLDVDAFVNIYDLHLIYEKGPFRANALMMYGSLSNADAVSTANRNLSNNLNVKRTPVGSEILGYYAEVGYDLLSLFPQPREEKLFAFGRYDFYDSMHGVTGEVFDNPRWERRVITGGLNYHVHHQIAIKVHYSSKKLGSKKIDASGNTTNDHEFEKTFSLGLGFEF